MLLGGQTLVDPGVGKEGALASRAGGVCPHVPDCLFSVRRVQWLGLGGQVRCHWSRLSCPRRSVRSKVIQAVGHRKGSGGYTGPPWAAGEEVEEARNGALRAGQKQMLPKAAMGERAAKSERCKQVTVLEAWGAEKRGSEGRPLQQHRRRCRPSEVKTWFKDGGLLGYRRGCLQPPSRVRAMASGSPPEPSRPDALCGPFSRSSRVEAYRTGKPKRPVEEHAVGKGQACTHAVAKYPNRLPGPTYESVLEVEGGQSGRDFWGRGEGMEMEE